jgi:hypothetical protein
MSYVDYDVSPQKELCIMTLAQLHICGYCCQTKFTSEIDETGGNSCYLLHGASMKWVWVVRTVTGHNNWLAWGKLFTHTNSDTLYFKTYNAKL